MSDALSRILSSGISLDKLRDLLDSGLSLEEVEAAVGRMQARGEKMGEKEESGEVRPDDFSDVGNMEVFSALNAGRLLYTDSRGWLAHILQAHGYNVEPGRSQSFGEVPDLSGLPGVHIECKRVERLNISQAMAQAVRDAERFQDGAPAVFHRRNREPWLVTMRLEDWLDIWGSSQSPGNLAKSRKIST